MSTNEPTNGASLAAITARNAEYTGTPFTDVPGDGTYASPYLGMNRAGGSNPGVGINTGSIYQTAVDLAANGPIYSGWTTLDQAGAGRTPQDSQTLGGIVDAAPPYAGVPYPTPAQVGVFPVTFTNGADINDTANLVVTDSAAVAGDVMDSVTGAINGTGVTVAIGDIVWGEVIVV